MLGTRPQRTCSLYAAKLKLDKKSRKARLFGQFGTRLVRKMAEREGFEPSIRFWRILTFQASAFDHSATAPHALEGDPLVSGGRQGKAARVPACPSRRSPRSSPPASYPWR